MEAHLVSFRREFLGVPYHVHCEDKLVSGEDVAWLLANIFDPDNPVVDLAPGSEARFELFRSLYLDGNFLTEISAVLELEAQLDPALLERHQRLRLRQGPAEARAECRALARRAR